MRMMEMATPESKPADRMSADDRQITCRGVQDTNGGTHSCTSSTRRSGGGG